MTEPEIRVTYHQNLILTGGWFNGAIVPSQTHEFIVIPRDPGPDKRQRGAPPLVEVADFANTLWVETPYIETYDSAGTVVPGRWLKEDLGGRTCWLNAVLHERQVAARWAGSSAAHAPGVDATPAHMDAIRERDADRLPNGGHEMTTLDEMRTTERAAFTDGLRAVADWLDANPEVALPYPHLAIFSSSRGGGTALEEAAAFAAAPGRCEKSMDEATSRINLTRYFGPVALIWSAIRSGVCEKRMRTVEEWHCPDSLLRELDENAAAGGVGQSWFT